MTDDLVDEVMAFITARDRVTFMELKSFLRHRGAPTEGTLSVEAWPNGVLWAGMSEEFVALVNSLRASHQVDLVPGNWLAYLHDGSILRLPPAKRAPREQVKGYAQPRWIVTAFRPMSTRRPVGLRGRVPVRHHGQRTTREPS
jgi:hypothetical protein